MLPKIALIDPELTLTLPPAVTASSGLDAFTQVIEPYVSLRANPMVDMFCIEGIKNIFFSIETAYLDGNNLKAREDMAWGSLLGGLSLANSGLGTVHGFSSVIGGMFDIPHGVICARLLPIIMNANIQALQQRDSQSIALSRYRKISALVTRNHDALIGDGIAAIRELVKRLGIPGFTKYGMSEKDISQVVKGTLNANSTKANPIQLNEDELAAILLQAL